MFHVIRWRRSENEYLVFTFTHTWSFRDVMGDSHTRGLFVTCTGAALRERPTGPGVAIAGVRTQGLAAT